MIGADLAGPSRTPRSIAAGLAVGIAAISIAGTLLNILGRRALALGPIEVTLDNPWRPLAAAALASSLLLFLTWHRRSVRALSCAALLICFFLSIALVTREVPSHPSFSDGAVFELYVRNAAVGQQILGAYSQFGWNHPGPIVFYSYLPLYWLGGETQFALNGASFAANVLAILVILWVTVRRGEGLLAPLVMGLLLIYAIRLPELASSFWNPHALVLPLAALLLLCAAVAAGEVWLIPAAAITGTWVVQCHIGLTLPVLACAATSALLHSRGSAPAIPVRVWWTTAIVLAGLWLLPVADQVINAPGNMRRVVEFFLYGGGDRPALTIAAAAFSAMTLGVVRPGFYLARGWAFESESAGWVLVAAAGIVALAAAAIAARRRGANFSAGLGACCLAVLAAGALSAISVRTGIGDYHLFYLSIAGVLSIATVANAVLRDRVPMRKASVVVLSVLLAAGAAVVWYRGLAAALRPVDTVQSRTVEEVSKGILEAKRNGHLGTLLIEVDPSVWDIAAGVVLELRKADVELAAEPHLVRLYGPPFRASGREDMLLTIAGRATHAQVMRQPGRTLIAESYNIQVSTRPILPLEPTFAR
jgi:hypothetical protein